MCVQGAQINNIKFETIDTLSIFSDILLNVISVFSNHCIEFFSALPLRVDLVLYLSSNLPSHQTGADFSSTPLVPGAQCSVSQ